MSSELNRYRRNVTSQCGEDGIVEHLLTLLPDTPKTCLEVGAGDGVSLSNTHTLWAEKGWRALLIEGGEARFELLKATVSDKPNVTPVKAMIAPAGEHSIDEIARRTDFPRRLGVLSLDIDSNDLEIFETLRDVVPDIVIIEFNHEIPAEISYRDLPGDIFFRHSAKAVETVAKAKNYLVVACTGPNAILVREAAMKSETAAQLPRSPIETLFDNDFVRSRRRLQGLVQSKFITEELAVAGRPSPAFALLRNLIVAGRKLRRALRGKKPGAPVTPARREHLKRAGLWV